MAKLVSRILSVTSGFVLLAISPLARAQTTPENFIATVNVTGSLACAQIEVKLAKPAAITTTEPAEKALDVVLHLEPSATALNADGKSAKETAAVPPQNPAGLGSVIYDPASSGGPVVHLVFAKVMAYKLKHDGDSSHIAIDVAAPEDAPSCLGFKPAEATEAKKNDKSDLPDPFAKQADAAKPTGSDAEAALAEGKKQLAGGDFNRATAFFTKAVDIGAGKIKQEAQEMLGLSHERAMQLAFARAEYETYLKNYPSGPDAARVKERLTGVMAAMEDQANKQFALHQTKTGSGNNLPQNLTLTGGKTNLPAQGAVGAGTLVTNLGLRPNITEPAKDPKAWVWTKNGSISQSYYRDDNFVPTAVGQPVFGAHNVFQNEVISTADGYIRGENQDYAVEAHVSAFNEQGLGDQANIANTSLSTVYLDGKLKGPGLSARVGRQSKSNGGIFGRFDGAVLGWEINKNWKVSTAVGSPVYGRNAMPFADSRYFYGGTVEFNTTKKDFGGSFYAMQQNIGDIVDRRAIGGEAHYNGEKGSIYSAADYDLFFGALNNAYATGTWLPRQGTTVYATADYRRLPFLLTSNALIGQSDLLLKNSCTIDCSPFNRPDPAVVNLQTLVGAVGLDNAYQWASDRTATSKSISGGVTQQLNDKWSASLDATLAYYTGTPASGFVDGTPDPGLDFYSSVTLSGSSIFRLNDTLTGSMRYSNGGSGASYMVDGFYRIPINDKLRLGPRLRLSYRPNQSQYLVQSSVNVGYKINNNWSFESEIGARYQNTAGTEMVDVLASAGYRYDFQ